MRDFEARCATLAKCGTSKQTTFGRFLYPAEGLKYGDDDLIRGYALSTKQPRIYRAVT